MDEGWRCPRRSFPNPVVAALSEALLAMGREKAIQEIFRQVVEAVRRLAGARWAGLGILREDGGITQFTFAGVRDTPLLGDR